MRLGWAGPAWKLLSCGGLGWGSGVGPGGGRQRWQGCPGPSLAACIPYMWCPRDWPPCTHRVPGRWSSGFTKMAKRVAEKELTYRNWDEEDEVEEMGTFSVASEEVMKNRAVKKSKRRNAGFESDRGGRFKGLVVPSGGGGGFSAFGGGSGGKPLEGLTNGNSTDSAMPFSVVKTAAEPKAAFGSFAVNGRPYCLGG